MLRSYAAYCRKTTKSASLPAMILLARPAPHLLRTHQALHARGIANEAILSFSLAEPEILALNVPPQATALIVTSPLACPALSHLNTTLPVYCVGPTTAEAATQAGAHVIFTGTDNGHTMAQEMCTRLTQPHHFAHLHGDHAGMEWHTILQNKGHTVTPVAAYRTGHIQVLPNELLKTLQNKPFPNYTLLFSAGSAQHLANLLKQANIHPSGTALCLSPAVAMAAAAYWPHTRTAQQPTLEGLLNLLQHETDTTP